MKRVSISAKMRLPIFIALCVLCVILQACNGEGEEEEGFVVRRGNRRVLVSTENGEIAAARVGGDIDGGGGSYLLHFFTMDPNSLFLPAILHSDMVFYVHTGSGKLSWTDENELKTADLRRGDVYRLKSGSVFFVQSNLETETQRQKLRIHSIFPNSNTDMHEPPTGPYSSIRDMVLGFDKKVLQAAFKVPEEVIEELLNGTKPPAIIHGVSKSKSRAWEMEAKFLGSLLGSSSHNIFELSKKRGKGKSSAKLFNLFKEDKDFENRNGWSTTVTGKKLSALKGTNIGLFMVNLTAGSMMGPHWNPVAAEVAVVVQGRGMVRVVCSGILNKTGCGDMRFDVEEGDIFAVPRFHPMAQMAFNNETFVFMGFSSSAKKNHPQFLAGQASVIRTLSRDVLATSFDVGNTTMDRLLASQQDSVILGCISCAEEELRILEEEREREREEAREREEEEARKREEEEARKREEERRREEEEAREREEEEARKREEERRREEEEAERQEEERKRREEEEEEAARREEEERKRREEEEEEAARREEEERKRREEEEEEEAARREEEERRRRQEEEAARKEEEERRRREEEEEEEEEAARREEEERKRREEEEEAARRAEEERQRQEEEEEERRRQQAAAKKREEEERRRREEQEEEEEEMAKREEEERRRREEEEEERRRQRAAVKKRERQRQEEEEEEEMARREEEERQRREERRRGEERRRRRGEEEEHEERWSEEEEAAEGERRREQEERREEEARRREEEDEREREE